MKGLFFSLMPAVFSLLFLGVVYVLALRVLPRFQNGRAAASGVESDVSDDGH